MSSSAQHRTLREDVLARWPAALAGLAGLIVLIPVWLKSYVPYGYDSLFHLFSLVSLDQRIAAGDVYPLRFPSLAYGYGWAELSYYPPLSPYLLELVHLLGANYVVTYKLGMTLFMVGAALSSYALGATLFNRYAGLVVAIIYVFNPYFLSLISPRGALAEMLGLAVAPLVFLAVYQTAKAPGWRTYLATSLTGALLILSHPLSTFLFAPFLLAFAGAVLVTAARAERKRAFGVLIAATFTGVLLSCFYWLPVQAEPGGLRTFDFPAVRGLFLADLKPLHQILSLGWFGAAAHSYPAVTFSIASFVLMLLSVCCFVVAFRRRVAIGAVWFWFFLVSTLVAFILMSRYAVPLWQTIPLAVYLQFPFRWFSPVALFSALVIGGGFAAVGSGWPGRLVRIAVPVLLVLCMATAKADWKVDPMMLASAGVPQVAATDINDLGLLAFEHDVAYGQANKENCWIWAYEYVPSTSSLSDCHKFVDTMLNDTPARSTLLPVQARLIPDAADANRLEAQVSSPEPWTLSLHAFWIPGWAATIDGVPARTMPTDAIGVVGVSVPAGEHRVRLAFGPTPLRVAAIVISLLALGVWLALAWWRHRRLAAAVTLALLILVGLVGGQALRAPAAPAVQLLDVNYGNQIGLQGFALDKTGDTLAVRLVWLARAPMEESYKVFIHVIDDQGKLLAQTDSRPQQYASNTNRWIPGQVVTDRFEVPLPPDAPPGHYQVRIGLYNEANGERLPVLDAAGEPVDDQVLLGYFEAP